jgi:putative GTP pyrophosphokinase
MKVVKLKYSKSKIDKAGEALKKVNLKGQEKDEVLATLSNWRAYHAMPLDTFAKVLKTRIKKIAGTDNQNIIVAQRLKRTPSILLKLKTHATMRLSAMQDIGGVRAIIGNVDDVYNLVNTYRTSKSRHKLFALHDYISTPKVDGYRSVHLVYQIKKAPSIFIEIQIRSYLQHIWATAVEVFGTLKNSSFKSGHGDKKWLDLFAYLSSVFSLKEKTPVLKKHIGLTRSQILNKLKKLIGELKAIEQLNVYTAIYRITSNEVREKGRSGNYSLILLDSHKNTISIQTFSSNQIEEATSAYMEMEKKFYNDENINLVLVNTGDIKKLEASYPNYFMDTKVLIRYLSQIMIDEF